MRKNSFSAKKKDKKKLIRGILQGMILFLGLYAILTAMFFPKKYEAFEGEGHQRETGFIAISYFGVDIVGDETLISSKRLDAHIKALKASGYVTITQEDIKAYYQDGKKLPEKALFLMFEDGRRDTAVFAQKILERYNYKASILSYANNLENKDNKFLNAGDIKTLQENSFWEMGTNGYRLSYINAFDRHNNFFGQLNTKEFQMVSTYLDRNYNHYLMDFIRDEYGIPMETYEEMRDRITKDYSLMEKGYSKAIGYVPGMYVLMHSNTGAFGTNNRASAVNEENISRLFDMNFNREGYSRNHLAASIYDLTRIQPQAYWSTNHLLMRIWEDTQQEVAFVSGDEHKKGDWNTILGESEFIEDRIILTALPRDKGLIQLKDSRDYKDIALSLNLEGNKIGSQRLYLRSDENFKNFICIELVDDALHVIEGKDNESTTLFTLDLNTHDGIDHQTMGENRIASEIRYLEAKIKYTEDMSQLKALNSLLEEKKKAQAEGLGVDEAKYIPRTDIREKGSRLMEISLKEDRLSLSIDKKVVFQDMKVSVLGTGYVALEAAYNDMGYSQRNLADSVYDGVFKALTITDLSQQRNEILYTNRLTGMEKAIYNAKQLWQKVLNWFIKNL